MTMFSRVGWSVAFVVWTGLTTRPAYAQPPTQRTRSHASRPPARTSSPTLSKNAGYTLRALIAYAHRHNPSLQVFRTRMRQAKAAVKGSRVFPNNPVLTGRGGAQLPSSNPNGSSSPLLPRVSARLALALPVGGRWKGKQRWAEAQLRRIQREQSHRTYALTIRVHKMWLELAFARKRRKLQLRIVSFVKRLTALTRLRTRQGVGNQLETQLALATELQAEQELRTAQIQEQLRQQKLSELIGWQDPTRLRVQATPPAIPSPPPLATLLQQLPRRHPRILAARAAQRQAKAALRWAQAKAIPDLTLLVGYSLEEGSHIVTGGLSIPLPLFWRNQGKIGQERARIRQAALHLRRVTFSLQQKLRQAYRHYQNDLSLLRLYKKRLRTSQKQFDLIERGLKLGLFTPIQTLTSQRSIVQTRLLRLQSQQHALLHYVDICQASGLHPAWTKGGTP